MTTGPWSKWLGAAILVVLTCGVYYPSLHGEFLLDDSYLTSNNVVRSSDGLLRFWTTADAPDYWPMTNSSFWLEWRLWGSDPTGYHVTNLVLHIAASLLLWAILNKLSIPGAFLAALLFAVHPVNVESVAWIAQRKNTLAMLFFLLSIWWYLQDEGEETREERRESTGATRPGIGYWLSLLAFLLAMLSKGSVAMLPGLLLLIDWWKRGRIVRRDLTRTAPFFVVAVVLVGVNIWFQTHGKDVVVRDVDFSQRLAGAGTVVWFYLSKALAPENLAFVYPQWQIQARNLIWWLPLAAAIAATAVLLWRRRARLKDPWSRALLFAWLFFCVALLPVMGFTDVGFMRHSLVADHYQHIALLGVVALIAAGWSCWQNSLPHSKRLATRVTAIVVVGLLATLTWRQNKLYADPITLYSDTLIKNPDCWMAENNLSTVYLTNGHIQESLQHIQQALRIKPDSSEANFNMGMALDTAGRYPEAIQFLQTAIKLKPEQPEPHNTLGNVLKKTGHLQAAIDQYQEALRYRSDYAEAHNNLGSALLAVGRAPEAIVHLQQGLRLKPNYPEALSNLGMGYVTTGRAQEAIALFQQALKLKPDFAEAHSNLGVVLASVGRLPEAIEQYELSLRTDPNSSAVHINLGLALANTGHVPEAIEHFQQAIKLAPESMEGHSNLGNVLSNSGRLPEAVAEYQEALRLQPNNATVWNNLAVAYSRLKQNAEAKAAANKAIEIARTQGQTALAERIEGWLKTYSAGESNSSK